MKRHFFIICCFFYFLKAAETKPQNEMEGNFIEAATAHPEVTPACVCDEHLYQDIERNFKILNLAQENQNLRYELLAHKVDKLTDQLSQLLAAKSSILIKRQSRNDLQFKDCDDALSDAAAKDGVYHAPFSVYCMRHPETREAWTIIQRRMNGKVNFYRGWNEYVAGFGHLNDEHWLGLRYVHDLTDSRTHQLWIQLGDFENKTRSAFYDSFVVGSGDEDYALESLGQYSGDAGDSLRFHEGQKFSTKDRNDACASSRKGAWWYANCKESNLNGKYLFGAAEANQTFGTGIYWTSWHGDLYSLKYAHMAIRAVN